MSEFATTWCLARLYYGYHKPFVLYGAFWKKILTCLEQNLILRGTEDKVYRIATTPKAVLRYMAEFEKEFARRLGRVYFEKRK